MTWFQITSHRDDRVRGLMIKGQMLVDGRTTILEYEQDFARSCGTELVVMHEFEVKVDSDDRPTWLVRLDEAKRISDAFWMGYDACREGRLWKGDD